MSKPKKPSSAVRAGRSVEPAWSDRVAIADIPEAGRRLDLVADDAAREAIAKLAGLVALPRLEAHFDLLRIGADGLRVTGRVSATVVQSCVVTLDQVESEIDEEVELQFAPQGAVASEAPAGLHGVGEADPPETLQDGFADLGAVATEFLLLGIDPYPRKPDAVFDAAPVGNPGPHPFAALAALKKDGNPN